MLVTCDVQGAFEDTWEWNQEPTTTQVTMMPQQMFATSWFTGGDEIICHSSDEFETLIDKHFGIGR
jgi:hypothetical protein